MPTVANDAPVLQSDALQNSRFDQGAQTLPPLLQGYINEVFSLALAKFTPAFCVSSKRKQSTARFRQ
jgi:hypothetical protein